MSPPHQLNEETEAEGGCGGEGGRRERERERENMRMNFILFLFYKNTSVSNFLTFSVLITDRHLLYYVVKGISGMGSGEDI